MGSIAESVALLPHVELQVNKIMSENKLVLAAFHCWSQLVVSQ